MLSDEDYPPVKPLPKFQLSDTVAGVTKDSSVLGSITGFCQVYHNNIHAFFYNIESTNGILTFIEEDDIELSDQLILVLEILP